MCWCTPEVRTPCCGTERCHDAARRRWVADRVLDIRIDQRRGFAPGVACAFCERAKVTSTRQPCPTCKGSGTVVVSPSIPPGTADAERRYDKGGRSQG